MKALIIYAHPKTQGHCPEILKETEKSLNEKKVEFETIDLYDIGYDPILHEKEHYTSGNKDVSKQNKAFQKKIKEFDLQIYIYPVWWGTMPAILKGFFDKVMVSHFGFKYVKGIPIGLLKDKKAIIMTTCGAPSIYYRIYDRGPIRNIRNNILGFCGIRSKMYLLGRSLKMTENRKKKIKKMVKKALKSVR